MSTSLWLHNIIEVNFKPGKIRFCIDKNVPELNDLVKVRWWSLYWEVKTNWSKDKSHEEKGGARKSCGLISTQWIQKMLAMFLQITDMLKLCICYLVRVRKISSFGLKGHHKHGWKSSEVSLKSPGGFKLPDVLIKSQPVACKGPDTPWFHTFTTISPFSPLPLCPCHLQHHVLSDIFSIRRWNKLVGCSRRPRCVQVQNFGGDTGDARRLDSRPLKQIVLWR